MSMEHRAILAALLMAAMLIVWHTLFAPAPPEPPSKPAAEAPGRPAAPAPPTTPPVAPPPAAVASPGAPAAPAPPQRTATVETPLYRAVVSSEGGKLQEWTLNYRGLKPMVDVGNLGPAGLLIAPAPDRAPEPVALALDAEALRLGPARPGGELALAGEAGGLRVRQALHFEASRYVYEVRLRVENPGPAARTITVALAWSTRTSWGGTAEKFPGQHPMEFVWSAGGGIDRFPSKTFSAATPEDLAQVGEQTFEAEWVAVGSAWYLAALMPRSPGFRVALRGEPPPADKDAAQRPRGRATAALQATPTIPPGGAWEGQVAVYVGPKEYDRLREHGLEGTLNFGGFPVPRAWGGLPMEWVGVPILRLMNWVYRYVGNYGVAIILLTVLTKALFYPLSVKSVRSMKAMQVLQPQVNALRSKYKSDPRKLQEETMALYRKHRVNPMGGCLPMVAQIPVFYALYLALSVSVELQNAAFLCFGRLFGMDLWICDLASYDPTYVLPILMGVTMFVQQKMTPTPGDPRQAKMMLIMPFIFTFMFLNLPSGLVLYWTVSNVLQILQQWYMDRPRGAPRQAAKARA